MSFKKLVFDGDIEQWFVGIMDSNNNLLLCGPHHGENISPEALPAKERHIGLYTSATTGKSKCIWNTFDRLRLNAKITAREFEISEGDRLLMMAKPWHVAGLSWVLMAESMNLDYKFIPTKKGEDNHWYNVIQEVQPDYLLTVPAVLRSLFAFDDWFVSKIVFGGSPIRYEDYKPLSEHTEIIYQGYGQTEAGGLISCLKIDLNQKVSEAFHNCYGHPPEEFEVRCSGTKANPQPIYLKSPSSIYSEFYNTGDVGYLDADERLFLAGRNQKV